MNRISTYTLEINITRFKEFAGSLQNGVKGIFQSSMEKFKLLTRVLHPIWNSVNRFLMDSTIVGVLTQGDCLVQRGQLKLCLEKGAHFSK